MIVRVFDDMDLVCFQIIHAELLVKSKNTNGFSRAAESAKFAKEIEANTIVFKTSNGRIERIFPSAFESAHILNVKRGIISTLQLGGEENAEEVDVNGRCKVSITKENGMIVKSKNLSECSERTHSELGFQTASFEKKEAVCLHCAFMQPVFGGFRVSLL